MGFLLAVKEKDGKLCTQEVKHVVFIDSPDSKTV